MEYVLLPELPLGSGSAPCLEGLARSTLLRPAAVDTICAEPAARADWKD